MTLLFYWRWEDPSDEAEIDDTHGPLSLFRKVRFWKRPTRNKQEFEAVAQKLHNNRTMRLREPGQSEAVLAVMGPGAAKQVIAVLATGSGKSLIFMVSAALEGAGTTIVIISKLALRGNVLARVAKTGIRTITWGPGEKRSALLVVMSPEAACKMSFLEYAHGLEMKRKLDCIVIDESHLTVTATF
jgi:superfamily II DNA helicase RecQ